MSQVRVSQVKSEIKAKSEPKLLKHGGNMAEQGDYRHVYSAARKAWKDAKKAKPRKAVVQDAVPAIEINL